VLKASAQGGTTRERILDAAFETLRRDGFAQTSARAIARRGGFNQALIFYHFGTVQDLLLAAMDRLGAERMGRYRDVLGETKDPVEVARRVRRLYLEDVDSGLSTVVAELFAASSGQPELRSQMLVRMRPWVEFTEGLIDHFLAGTPFAGLLDAHAAAGAAMAMYIGMDMLIHLDGDRSRADAVFDSGDRLAATVAPLFGGDSR
jgi:AcrR family transcriptional regulator